MFWNVASPNEVFQRRIKESPLTILYLLLNLGSLSIPLVYSFHPRIQISKKWKAVIIALSISATIYIIWDVIFTKAGVWGFNPEYLIGWYIFGLPIEELLFFICIPYASVFTHFTLVSIYPGYKLGVHFTKILNWIILVLLLVAALFNPGKAYTLVNGLFTMVILLITMIKKPEILSRFYLTYLVILIPFFVVNGILTGSFIKDEVVWYNNAENLGLRLLTIPVEDFFYGFGLILLSILIIELLSSINKSGFSPPKLSSD